MTKLRVTVENLSEEGGTFGTPFWVAAHNGGFDTYNRGEAASEGLERLAEDGATSFLSDEFNATEAGVDGVVVGRDTGAPGPIDPQETATTILDVDRLNDRFFSYASMVIPSNDAFIANGNPTAIQLFDTDGNFLNTQDIIVTGNQVLDAGTEVNTELDAAFINQTAPDTGIDENGVVTLHPGFIGSQGNPNGTPIILGGTTAAGTTVTTEAGDFTLPDTNLFRISFSVFEEQIGTNGDDVLIGTALDDNLVGLAGDDVLVGGKGNDTINGGAGDDLIRGGVGNDIIIGGTGNDTIDAGHGNDVVTAGAGNDVVFGDAGNDFIRGNAGHDFVLGQNGNDTIDAGRGNDTVNAGEGNDVAFGDAGDDHVNGGAGNDIVAGQGGDDVLTGGAGQDTFLFLNISDSNNTSDSASDVITDFAVDADRITLSNIVTSFNELTLSYDADSNTTFVDSTVNDFGFALTGNFVDTLEANDFTIV